MKTKRTLFPIVVFLSVFWISILISLDTPSYKRVDNQENKIPPIIADNTDKQSLVKAKLNALSDKYGSVASTSNRLYQYEDDDTDSQTVQNTNTLEQESTISDHPLTQEDQDEHDKFADFRKISALVKPSVYSDIGISTANSYVNIRDKATTDSETNGKLYKNSAAKILDSVGDWYYIESGSVKGYVKRNYLKTGIPDEELIDNYGTLRIFVKTDGLNVREEPDIESKKVTVIYQNEIYPVIDLRDEWLKVDIIDDRIIGYVSRDYVELLVDFEKAISKEEEEELEKLQDEERVKKETEVKYRDEVDYTQEQLKLLACLVHAEAGNQSYEGKLAVANVVLNRVKSSKYPNAIKDIIYQPGQFTVASSGSLAKQLAKYESYSSKSQQMTIKAAKAALSGANNISNRLYFNAYKSAKKKGYDQKKTSIKIEDHLFW